MRIDIDIYLFSCYSDRLLASNVTFISRINQNMYVRREGILKIGVMDN